MVTVQDVTDEVAANEALAFQAMHDHLTGLPNRALFLDRLNLELSHAERTGTGLAVMFLDLDRFKVINDGLGHQTGDELLKSRGRRLQAGGALGGDRGAPRAATSSRSSCTTSSGPATAAGVAKRILDVAGRAAADRRPGGGGLRKHRDRAPRRPWRRPPPLLRDADAAMYRAKEAGRARFEIFDEEQRRSVVDRLDHRGRACATAIEHGELRLHYQPMLSASRATWSGPRPWCAGSTRTRGLLQPAEFIAVAEETGLIVPLGEWVFRTAAADSRRWDGQGAPLRQRSPSTSRPGSWPARHCARSVRDALHDGGSTPRRSASRSPSR